MIDPVAAFRAFLIDAAATFPGDVDRPGERLAENIYAVPDDNNPLADFPPERRAIVIQIVPGTDGMHGLATVRFYCRTYGNGAADAFAVARWLYDLGTVVQDGRRRMRSSVRMGASTAKWLRFSYPAATLDEDSRSIGFLDAVVRIDLYQ